MDKKLFKKADIIVIAAVALLCALLIIVQSAGGKVTAYVYVDGEEYADILLGQGEDRELIIDTNPKVVIKAEGDCIYFKSADCPDKLCVNSGKLSRAGQTAACLPAGVVVTLRGEKKGFDAITGRIAAYEG